MLDIIIYKKCKYVEENDKGSTCIRKRQGMVWKRQGMVAGRDKEWYKEETRKGIKKRQGKV